MNFSAVFTFLRRNLDKIEAILIVVIIAGASITLVLGGLVKPQTIRIVDVSPSASPPYGESASNVTLGYIDNYTNWTTASSAQLSSSQNSLVVRGIFQNVSTWTAIDLFKSANVNITAYPLLNLGVNLTEGVRYGIRFYSQYSNGTTYNVWWEGSPLDHRPAKGSESLRVNMQREAFLATGRNVSGITGLELYVEDPPFSPQVFQFTLSKLSFERDGIEPISEGQYRAIYFDLRNAPRNNASWYLDKINSGVTVQASRGSIFSIYFFDGPTIYASTTAAGLEFDSLTSYSQYTFYPDLEPQVFPELLPLSNTSIVFVATAGTLQRVTIDFTNFEFLPTIENPDLSQQSVGLYYVQFILFLFSLPVSVAILVFREFLSRKTVPKASLAAVLISGMLCRIALAATTAHPFDINVYLASSRGWFQYGNPLGSLGPTLPLTFFLYWTFYSPYAVLQLAGFQDLQLLGHAAGLFEAVFVKLFPIAMDIITFFLLFRFRHNGAAFVWATFYFLNPLTILVSSVWGQYESATAAFIVWGIYWMSRQKYPIAALAFVASGMVELLGFLPFLLLLLNTARMRLYKALSLAVLTALPVAFYPLEALIIFRLFLGLAGFINGGLSRPGPYTIFGSFPQLLIIAQFRPLLILEAMVLGVAAIDIYRNKMCIEKLILYIALSSLVFLLFSNILASWLWLVPTCLLYAIVREKNDLGAFMLVFGTALAFLEVAYAFGSGYLILGNAGYAFLTGIEGVKNQLKIFSVMLTSLSIILLFFLRFGNGQAERTMLRTTGMVFSLYLLSFFWLGVYSP